MLMPSTLESGSDCRRPTVYGVEMLTVCEPTQIVLVAARCRPTVYGMAWPESVCQLVRYLQGWHQMNVLKQAVQQTWTVSGIAGFAACEWGGKGK